MLTYGYGYRVFMKKICERVTASVFFIPHWGCGGFPPENYGKGGSGGSDPPEKKGNIGRDWIFTS